MRILSTTIILLFTIHTIKSSEDAGFAIKEVSNEISNVPRLAESSFLEHELLNGKMTPMDLMEKILGRKVDQNGLDEYSKMDISNGIKKQNELMDLFEKAKKSETSDKDKKDIEDGFDQLEGIKDMKPIGHDVTGLSDILTKQIRMIGSMISLDINFDRMRFAISEIPLHMDVINSLFLEILKSAPIGQPIPEGGKEIIEIRNHLQELSKFYIQKLLYNTQELQNNLKLLETFNFISPVKSIKYSIDFTQKLKDGIEKMKNLDGLGSKLLMMESEMKVLEQLRDSLTIPEIPKFLEKLKISSDSVLRLPEDAPQKYGKVETISKFLLKIAHFKSYIRKVESRISEKKDELETLKTHLESLKMPTGSLSEKFAGLKSCLDQYDFSIDVSNDLAELNKFQKSLEEPWNKIQKVVDMYKLFKMYRDFGEFCKLFDAVDKIGLKEVLEKTVWTLDVQDLIKKSEDFREKFDRPGKPGERMSAFEKLLREGLPKLPDVDRDHIQTVTDGIKTKSEKIEQLLKCYSGLNVVPSDIKSLIDLPKEVWNFDPKQMENTVEVVDSLKEANKMMNELKNWKFDNNPLFDKFPLNSEDVQGILDGFESLKSIQNIQNNWIKMTNLDYSQIEKSDIKNEWNEMMTSFGSFIEQLSQMETHLKLSDIQLLISKIQFPSDIQIDLIIDFINIKYQGNDRNGILNILEDVKNRQKDFPFYSTKLQKMNESFEKLKKWMKEPEEEDPKIDCFENPSCSGPVTLPE